MDEADLNSVQQEVAPQEVSQTPQPAQPDVQEKNWRAVRQELAELKRSNAEKDELMRRFLESQEQKKAPEVEEPDDEYLNKGGVKKVAKRAMEPLEKEINELKSQLAHQKQQSMISSLRSKYTDFDDVVNPETIALFEEKEPELAAQIAEMKDPYKIGTQTYKFIKSSGILGDVPDKRHAKEAAKMLEKNEKTVQSPQAYDKRPMAQAFRMSEAEKTALYDEMMGFASMASSAPPMS